MDRFRQRLPSRAELASVFAIIILVIYTWTMLWFFWKLPSWMYFLNAREILMVFSYSLATNLLESLAVLAFPLLLAILLPKRWFADAFVARGAAFALAALGCLIYLAYQFSSKALYPAVLRSAAPFVAALALIVLAVYLAGRVVPLRRGIEFLAERATIFLYILVPLSLLSMLVILLHSLI
ncbi:MAG TPA: hypothetical protein VMJ64_13815, partial [Anaerolineales bacterium]|nr:hypothetical protein [Anaerolineales bacterium]